MSIKELYDKYKNHLFLISGFIFSIFSLGIMNISIFVFIWPFLFLHYLHIENNKKSLAFVIIALLLSNMIKWIGCSNLNILLDFVMGLYWGVVSIIPYIIDKIVYDKIDKWKSILTFPLSVSIVEFIFSLIPVSNVNILAYSQNENAVFLQIMSLFGIFFISFVIATFASILEYEINLYQEEKRISKYIFIYFLVIIFIYIYGSIRLLIPLKRGTIRTVSVLGLSQAYYLKGDETIHELSEYVDYIEQTVKKANSIDAKLISYAEEAFYINIQDYDNIISAAQNLSVNYNMFILLSLDVVIKKDKNYKNSNVLISNKGEILYEYTKHNPIPIVEEGYQRGKNKIKIFHTDIGKLSTVICFDLDFPMFINWVGRKHPDILIAPAWDYKGVADYHSQDARFKAIENGFNLVKNTADGVTITCDYKGRVLSYFKSKKEEDFFIVSEVYKHGIKTLYSFIGFFFNYLYIVGFFVLVFVKC